MSRIWRLIDTGPCDAFYNMALDEAIAIRVREGAVRPTLRLYSWDCASLSLGRFQQSSEVDLDYCRLHHIPVVRRPTGGRAVLHTEELTYAFSARTDTEPFSKGLLDSYRRISAAFSLAFQKMGVAACPRGDRERGGVLTGSPLCFESCSFGEIVAGGTKVIGSAQRRWKDGFLQQGSIPYGHDSNLTEGIFGHTCAARRKQPGQTLRSFLSPCEAGRLKDAVVASFEEAFGIMLAPLPVAPEEAHLARELQEKKYRRERWNLHRQTDLRQPRHSRGKEGLPLPLPLQHRGLQEHDSR